MNADDAVPVNKDELLPEEKLLSNVLGSMKLHAKSKLVIFQRLD